MINGNGQRINDSYKFKIYYFLYYNHNCDFVITKFVFYIMQSFLVQRIKFTSINQITKYLGFKSHFFLASTKLFSPEYNKNSKADFIMKNYFNKRN
jgi:hypothetical protein